MDERIKSKILIVDDDRMNLMYLNNLLSAEYTLYMAKDGAQAIKRVNEYLPDLILLDIIMPGMNGYEVLSLLKEAERTRDIPVIFITGLSGDEEEMKGLELGADDYISKPFNDAIVRLRIRNHLKIINQMHLIIEKELAEKSSRAKSEFLSRMSHELRTPMNAIINMTTLARNTEDMVKKNSYLDKSAVASRDLLRLVEDVLDISDLGDSRVKLNSAEFCFDAMLRSVLQKAEQLLGKKQQTFSADIDPSIPKILVGDERRLAQVIENLLSNAGKFTPENGLVQLKASGINVDNDYITIQIDVTDNGIGIPKDKQDVIFTTFEQADGGINRKYGGVGMGLYLSKIIVEKMGGEIWVESEPGQGSKFSFTFIAQIKQPGAETEKRTSFIGKTTLLADDIEINREIVMTLLEETQMQFVCARNGREAVEIFSANPAKFDLILMDVNMPEMDGVEATRRIRALTPKGALVPIIAITANTSPEDVENYLAAGMTSYLGKPTDLKEVLRKINLCIK